MTPALQGLADGFLELLEIAGDSATITTSAGSRSLLAIFEEPTSATVEGEPVELTGPVATVRTSDVPTNASGSLFVVQNRTFRIDRVEPDSLGSTKLGLSEK